MEKEYKISCPEGEHASLLASAQHVNESMRKIREGGKALGAERIAVMAAINIAHELINSQAENKNSTEITSRIKSLQKTIDATLNNHT